MLKGKLKTLMVLSNILFSEQSFKMETDRISQLFKDRTLLITGGSGFIGKTLIEKLIRSCPELKTIYLLVRTKKGKNPTDRLDDIFSNPVSSLNVLLQLITKPHIAF